MKGFPALLLLVAVGAGAFFAGRITAPSPSSTTTASPTTETKSSPAKAPVPTQSDRELMSSLNAVQSAVQTGVNSARYSELIATARTKLADLKLNSENSPLILPAAAYLEAHAMILSIWTNHMGKQSRFYVHEESDPVLFAFIKVAVPDVELVQMNLPARTYTSGIAELWSYTEDKLWPKILTGWKTFGPVT